MKNIIAAFVTFLVFCYGMALQAQNAIPATGGNASGSGGSASFSAGQVVYTTNTGTTGSAAQGVQQPFEISVVTEVRETQGIWLGMNIHPNPTADFLVLKIENHELWHLRYQLYDINGNLLQDNRIEGNETRIIMSNLISAVYFLKVTGNNQVIKTFKILKN